jgi:hypothetical protein
MATRQTIKKQDCDDVLSELSYMIQNIYDLRDHFVKTYGRESEEGRIHERHLTDIAEYIDWKLQILTAACPFDWKGLGDDVQSVVSVNQPGVPAGPDFSGGYVGG